MTARITRTTTARPVRALRTPYHSLGGDDTMRVPDWAQHRSVYRSSGRTLYLVETDRLDEARADLRSLGHAGWDVRIEENPSGSGARIALTRSELAKAA